MDLTPLTAISPLDGRYRERVAPLAEYFSEAALIRQRIQVEVHFLSALVETLQLFDEQDQDAVTSELADLLSGLCDDDIQAVKAQEAVTRHDVKAVEYWLKNKLQDSPQLAEHLEKIHLGLTSEDVNNLAYGRLHQAAVQDVIGPQLDTLLETLVRLSVEWADQPLLGRTHGQPATPTTLGKELAVFADRLYHGLKALRDVRLSGKLNGATGNWNALSVAYPQIDWIRFSDGVIQTLGLSPTHYSTQIEPNDRLAELFDAQRRINNVLTDLCRDLWLYVGRGIFRLKTIPGEIGSSAMPHKVNPIDFENAEGNLGVANALLVHLADSLTRSRLQRDLSGSTVIRNAGVALAYSYLATSSILLGLERIAPDLDVMHAELDQHPEVLAEAYQTILRAHGIPTPYEKLQTLTKGRVVTLGEMQDWVKSLELPASIEQRLLALTPSSYIGLAPHLARSIAQEVNP